MASISEVHLRLWIGKGCWPLTSGYANRRKVPSLERVKVRPLILAELFYQTQYLIRIAWIESFKASNLRAGLGGREDKIAEQVLK
jgi:hypothetical protein